MPKINQEEYEILIDLDEKYKWIVRDMDNSLYVFELKPYKRTCLWLWRSNSHLKRITEAGFQFIQWGNDEPYNIDELVEVYENSYIGSWEHAIEFSKKNA